MKKIAFAAIAVIVGIMPAAGADIRDSYKDAPASLSPVSTGKVKWTGFYIGGQVGYGNANHGLSLIERHDSYCFDQFDDQLSGEGETLTNSTTAPVDSFDPIGYGNDDTSHGLPFAFNAAGTCVNSTDGPKTGGIGVDDSIALDGNSRTVGNLDGLNSRGFIGGGQLGFDYAPGGRYLFGGFASYDLADMNSEGNIGDAVSFTAEKDDEWSIGARAGVIVGERTLFYLLAAYTQTSYDFTGRAGEDRDSNDVKFKGISVGGGVEYAVTDNIFVGLQYVHTFYDEETVTSFDLDTGLPGHRLDLVDDLDEDKIMLTAKFKLGAIR